jgi:hypothetical protein
MEEIENQMRTMTGARGEGIGNEAGKFRGVRVDSAKALFALALAESKRR